MTNKNIAVVGAGIVGASVAWHLSKCGMDVSVFDKNEPGTGASGHSFAWINAFSKQPRHYYDLNNRSMDRWPRFAEDLDEEMLLLISIVVIQIYRMQFVYMIMGLVW